MASTFRLLSAGNRERGQAALFHNDDGPPDLDIPVWHARAPDSDETAISVILGSNGRGKSRFLGALADAFTRLHPDGRGQFKNSLLRHLDYEVDGQRVSLSSTMPMRYPNFPLPTKVVAVSLSPYDKFPLSPSIPREHSEEYSSFYNYVGLRDRMNRASVTALIYRAIENLAMARSRKQRARLADVFELLGYRPTVRVIISVETSSYLREFGRYQHSLFDVSDRETVLIQRMRTSIRNQRYTEDDLRDALNYAFRLSENSKGTISFELDFTRNVNQIDIEIEPLRLLRSLGLIRLSTVQMHKLRGGPVDLRDASSGEISIVTAFVSIASSVEDGSLVLLDEPETSLHPEWQARYIDLLQSVFRHFRGCHFIISTHSPIIVSDMPAESFVYSLDRMEILNGPDLSGKSSDYLLANAFDVIAPSNTYLRDQLATAVTMAADGMTDSVEFRRAVDEIERMQPLTKEGDRLNEIVSDLRKLRAGREL